MSEAVVMAVADAKGTAPTDLDTQLYEVVDPDALDGLFRPKTDGTPRIGGQVEFTMDGLAVTVDDDATVTVASQTQTATLGGAGCLQD